MTRVSQALTQQALVVRAIRAHKKKAAVALEHLPQNESGLLEETCQGNFKEKVAELPLGLQVQTCCYRNLFGVNAVCVVRSRLPGRADVHHKTCQGT